jgi:hypothetical protein
MHQLVGRNAVNGNNGVHIRFAPPYLKSLYTNRIGYVLLHIRNCMTEHCFTILLNVTECLPQMNVKLQQVVMVLPNNDTASGCNIHARWMAKCMLLHLVYIQQIVIFNEHVVNTMVNNVRVYADCNNSFCGCNIMWQRLPVDASVTMYSRCCGILSLADAAHAVTAPHKATWVTNECVNVHYVFAFDVMERNRRLARQFGIITRSMGGPPNRK